MTPLQSYVPIEQIAREAGISKQALHQTHLTDDLGAGPEWLCGSRVGRWWRVTEKEARRWLKWRKEIRSG